MLLVFYCVGVFTMELALRLQICDEVSAKIGSRIGPTML